MPNNIPGRQNEPEFTHLLKAYSRAYDVAEGYSIWKTRLAIGTALLVPLINALFSDFAPWGALIALFVLLVDELLFERAVKSNRELGAKIQEVFDTKLFEILWNEVRACYEL